MLVAIDRLLVRLRQVPARAAELAELTARLRTEHAAQPGSDERVLAHRIRAGKEELARTLGEAACCATCASGFPLPGGAYAGGHCCSGRTPDIFVDDEVAALAQAGTRVRDLTPPTSEHAGCAFRGAHGCTLAPGHRATLCHRFLCDDLRRDLHQRGRLDQVERAIAEIEAAYTEFVAARARRLDREWLDAIAPAR